MHEALLAGIHPKPSREVAQTSFIYRIFGGTCRSQVTLAAVVRFALLTDISSSVQSRVCCMYDELPLFICFGEKMAELCNTAALAVLHAFALTARQP